MLRKTLRHSLKFRLAVLSACLVAAISALLAFNYYSTTSAIHRETYLAMEGTLSLYRSHLTDNFHTMSLYMSSYVTDNSDVTVIAGDQRDTIEWVAATHRLQQKFISAQKLYPADGFFLFVPESGLFLTGTAIDQALEDAIRASISGGEWSSAAQKGKWITVMQPASGYLYQALRIYGCYVGAYIDAPAFLQKLTASTASGIYHFADEEGFLLGSTTAIPKGSYPPGDELPADNPAEGKLPGNSQAGGEPYTFVRIGGVKQMLIQQKLPFANLCLTALVPSDEMENSVRRYLPSAFFVIAATVLLLISGITAMRHWILLPVGQLTVAIRQLEQGDWSTAVEDHQSCTEFQEVNHAFNQMVSKVQALKIDVYEEQLSRQEIEMEYLKLQITPHFLINCLNIICQLSDAEQPELLQQMASDLSSHIRYTLSSGPVVPLAVEAEHIKNYISLSNIRYHDAIELYADIEESVLSCRVIPLLLLNFVENTIKHEVSIRKKIEIHIAGHLLQKQGENWVALQIWDTGAGFTEDLLRRLADIDSYVTENRSRHIGISNVFKRAQTLLGPCSFQFSNRPGAGAQIEILVPDRPYHEEGRSMDEPAHRG